MAAFSWSKIAAPQEAMAECWQRAFRRAGLTRIAALFRAADGN